MAVWNLVHMLQPCSFRVSAYTSAKVDRKRAVWRDMNPKIKSRSQNSSGPRSPKSQSNSSLMPSLSSSPKW